MAWCAQCGASLPADATRCSACGMAVEFLDERTVALPKDAAAGVATPGTGSGLGVASGVGISTSGNSGDFAPGTLLANRYRIVGLLGRGGMGEVYRADDLTLGQPVALKFLPEAFRDHHDRRKRFLQEVSLARQVSHPNVCRVYDVGEIDGHIFLSMEFIDGEDLSSLQRRIGRLPQEKALDIARQLCAGLAMLHERDVLHRDLKPANVMLDGRGRVRITDFGLAGLSQEISGAEICSGTPRYMAPEQLEGREVTVRSDIYSLGLVLYEVFAGAPAFEGTELAEIARQHNEGTPTSLSSLVPDTDPAVERVIARCLDKDPARRPSSAIAVATALPGGDPLAAALAMGETPSPELVAAAGGEGGLHPALGALFLLLGLAGIVVASGIGNGKSLPQRLDVERSAAALEERARQLVVELGYDQRPVDRVSSFARAGNLLNWIAENDSSFSRWEKLKTFRPSPLLLWYRQSPRYLIPQSGFARVSNNDPPPNLAEMVQVTLDAEGRLVYFDAVPPEFADSLVVADVVWARLFEAADLNQATFEPTQPSWIPQVHANERRAWKGVLPGEHGVEITIEAGGVGGRPVYFRLHGPWSTDLRTVTEPPRAGPEDLLGLLAVLTVLGGAAALALRNFRRKRTDSQGALRLAAVLLLMPVVRWLFGLHHVPLPGAEMDSFFDALSVGALYALLCLLLYLALEPFARRVWPQILIGWVRLLGGRWQDPMVGRSILVGGAAFGFIALCTLLRDPMLSVAGVPPPVPDSVSWGALSSPRALLAEVAMQVPISLFNTLFFLMLLVLFRMLLRRRWPGYIAFLLLAAGVMASNAAHWTYGVVVAAVTGAALLTVMVRGGLLAFLICFYLVQVFSRFPITFDFRQAYIAPSLGLSAGVAALLLYGLLTALAGRSLLRDEVR